MRSIGTLPTEADALKFSSALYLRGMENDVEEEEDGTFSVWVHDDQQLDAARGLLAKYREDASAMEFAPAVVTEAERAKAKAEKEDRARASRVITRERLEYERNFQASPWLPIFLIVCCVAVAFQSDTLFREIPSNTAWLRWLYISIYTIGVDQSHSLSMLLEVRQGEIWRLVTPMLIHGGPIHLLFNMMWLYSLGGFIQSRFSAGYLTAFILLVAAGSNLTQYLWNGPFFGGMSGVNYGLFGFLWMRGKFDRFAGWQLNPTIVQTMMIWFFLCFTPIIPNVANAAHLMGLLLGGAWGYGTAMWSNRRR